MTRVLALALNPAVDVEWTVSGVGWDEKNTIEAERRWAGGKGVNVARWLRAAGVDAELLLLMGGAYGRELGRHLRSEGLPFRSFQVGQETRVDYIVTTPAGRQLRFNPRGPEILREERLALFERIDRRLPRRGIVVMSGSLPRGLPATAYAQLAGRVRERGGIALVDSDGPVFAAAVKAHPFLLKPNEHELRQWAGGGVRTEPALRGAAEELSAATGGWVLLTRGARPAWLIHHDEDRRWTAAPPPVRIQNSVGAGDAVMASVAAQIARGSGPAEWLRWGMAAGAVAARSPGGHAPSWPEVVQLAGRICVAGG
ncbi:MAG TPA: hexose kinase [Candidatus Paceibacterota bacterium]|nr:hexose kinase [Verrucomicrobiota bacterium]HRZ46884.1 hexose kinase [Candidatus Paceibacterota bacterium]HRZ92495.1 hexose kinase [Candidatus Paceibacterota bacterium]